MPRHTHPRPSRKHSRAHVRHQRERRRERLILDAKRLQAGTTLLSWRWYYWGSDSWLEPDLLEWLEEHPYYATENRGSGPSREILREMPARLRREAGLALLVDDESQWRRGIWYCDGCASCKPRRYLPGFRTRVEALAAEEVEEGLEAGPEDDLLGRRVSAPVVREPQVGWC